MTNSTPASEPVLTAPPQSSSQGFVSLPYFQLPLQKEVLFNPTQHSAWIKAKKVTASLTPPHPMQKTLGLALAAHSNKNIWLIPRKKDCVALWDKYSMMDHIRNHSQCVADFMLEMAKIAEQQGANINTQSVYAAGLLHDLGKTYCIHHGGNHAQLGSAWVMRETGNPRIAQAVLYHVHWAWESILEDCMHNDNLLMVMFLIYADKRVMHDSYVSIEERFADLHQRYGKSDTAKKKIQASYEQGKQIEAAFTRRFGVDLHAHTINSGRQVKRT